MAKLVGNTEVSLGKVEDAFGEELKGIRVTIGLGDGRKQLSSWEIHEKIKLFRQEMEKENLDVIQVSNTELRGVSKPRTRI